MTTVTPDLTDVRSACELIAFGLARRFRPVDGSAYRHLLDRYRTDIRFKDVVDTAAEGLGLEILGAPRSGLVLAPDPSGPFVTRLSDMRVMNADERLVFGLVLLGIAAYAYPNDVDLDDPETKVIDVVKIDEFIRSAIGRLNQPDAADGSLAERAHAAAEVYADLPQLTLTSSGRRSRGCSLRAVEEVCGWLVEQGAAREVTSLGPDVYQLTDRFRLLVADSAGSDALEALAAIRRAQQAEAQE